MAPRKPRGSDGAGDTAGWRQWATLPPCLRGSWPEVPGIACQGRLCWPYSGAVPPNQRLTGSTGSQKGAGRGCPGTGGGPTQTFPGCPARAGAGASGYHLGEGGLLPGGMEFHVNLCRLGAWPPHGRPWWGPRTCSCLLRFVGGWGRSTLCTAPSASLDLGITNTASC